jgi:hypothetical protein
MNEAKVNEPSLDALMQAGLRLWASKTQLSAIET